MSPSYHIHPVTGTPAVCRAKANHCPFGKSEAHFASREEARKAFEHQMESEIVSTHEVDPIIAEAVRKLFEFHIQRTTDPDVQTLLRNAEEQLANAKSVVQLNRTAALFLHAAQELDQEEEDDSLAEASDMVGFAAETLKNYYWQFRQGIFSETEISDPFRRQPAQESALEALEELYQRELAIEALTSSENTHVSTKGHEATILRKPGGLKLGEKILDSTGAEKYQGRAGILKDTKIQKRLEHDVSKLIEQFSGNAGGYYAPEPVNDIVRQRPELPKGFSYIGRGEEANVYLHKASKMVYKLPHNRSANRPRDDRPEQKKLNSVVTSMAANYEKIDHQALHDRYGMDYAPTYFLSVNDGAGNPVGVIAQPYLDPARYVNYDPTSHERFDTTDAGVNDIHQGNLRLDLKTGRLVLFDCLFGV